METHQVEIDLDKAAEFILRKRGRIRARFVVVPVVLLWVASVAISIVVGRSHRSEFIPYIVGLYGCAAFFVHAYILAWRGGSFFWRYAALTIALLFYAALAAFQADDAGAWTVYSGGDIHSRPPAPALFWPVGMNAGAILLLVLHGFILGTGSHVPRPPRFRLRRASQRSAH